MEKKVWSTIYEKELDAEEFQHIGELRPPVIGEPKATIKDTKIAAITLPVIHAKWLPLLHICIGELRGDHAIDEMAEFIVLYEDAVTELAQLEE